jgi:Putative peptidoglycan binding domain
MQTSIGLKPKRKNVMRTLVVLICSLALVSLAYGAQKEEQKAQQKKQAQTAQRAAQPTQAAGRRASGKKASTATHQDQNRRNAHTAAAANDRQKGKKNETSRAAYERQKGKKTQTSTAAYDAQKAKKDQTQVERQTKAAKGGQVKRAGKPTEATTTTAARQTAAAKGKAAQAKPVKPQRFNVAKQPNAAKAPPVKFQQGKRIEGSQNWQGQQYTVFRNYKSEWHDKSWWHSRHNRIVFVFGAPYYWNAGYWFPAWGYYPNAYYAWDGPIYAYNNLPPDQVIANVQASLQQQGYYHGDVDGLIGPLTRGAIADYQRDHGLYVTSAIDEPTLESLGMA